MIISTFEQVDEVGVTFKGDTVELLLLPTGTTTDDTANRWNRTDTLMLRMSLEGWKRFKALMR
jgi:hypothetical protein